MLYPTFSEAWWNGDHNLCRRRLRPFSLWHYTYLQFVSSPLTPWGPKTEITWADLEQASRICRLGYLEQLPAKVNPILDGIRLFIIMSKTTLEKEVAAFRAYIDDYFSPPRFNEWKTEHPIMKRGGPPDTLSVASAVLMMFGGGPETEKYVWEMPIGQAYWYASTLHYNRGAGLDYMTARDEEWRQFLRKQRAEGKI